MRDKTQRIVIWVIIVLFLISTFGAVVYYVMQNKQQEKQQKDLQAAIQQAQDQQNQNSQQSQQSNPQTTDQNTSKLTGTKMTNFEPVASVTTLQKQELAAGTGSEVKAGDTVTVKYVGALAKNGTIFDASSDHSGGTFSFTVGAGQVIKGWDAGVPGMKVGEKRRLLIPSSLGYGSQAMGTSIPANSDLVFDVEVVKIGS